MAQTTVLSLALACVYLAYLTTAQSPSRLILEPFQGERVTESCLGCICEAMSGCNLTRGCVEDDCGMFRITKRYWTDAGQPTLQLDSPTTVGAYERCVTDPVCAARTVRGYMKQFINKDCNGDGLVDCKDYAASHFLSGYHCNQPLDVDYARYVTDCLALQPQI